MVEDRFPSQNYNRDSYNTTNNFETGVNNELKNENVAIGANAKAGYSIDERFQKVLITKY